MLIKQKETLFVHIPKTGGQSISTSLGRSLGKRWESEEFVTKIAPDTREFSLAHMVPNEYLVHNYLSKSELSNYFKFSFVRNPWDRLCSLYFFWTKRYDKAGFKDFAIKVMIELAKMKDPIRDSGPYPAASILNDFLLPKYLTHSLGKKAIRRLGVDNAILNDFETVSKSVGIRFGNNFFPSIRKIKSRVMNKKSILVKKPISQGFRRHILPQHYYTHSNGAKIVDFIGRFENIENHFGIVCDRLGMDVALPHVNKSNGKIFIAKKFPKYIDYYDHESLFVVKLLYGQDISTFGYVEYEKRMNEHVG